MAESLSIESPDMGEVPPEKSNQLPSSPHRKSGGFLGDVLKLVTGAGFSQVLVFLVAPIVTRLYSPQDLGVFTVFNSILAVLSGINSLRYEQSIMLPKERGDAANQLAIACIIPLIMGLIILPVSWFARESIANLFKEPDLAPILWMLAPFVLFNGVYVSLNYWNSRNRKYTRLSVIKVTNDGLSEGGKIGLAVAGQATGNSLIVSSFFGTAFTTILLAYKILRDDFKLFVSSIRIPAMIEGMKRYKKFPIYNTGSTLLSTFSIQMPVFLLSAFFSSSVAGYFGLGNRVLRVPMLLVGSSIAQVFFQRAAVAKQNGTLPALVESTFKRLLIFGMFPMLVLTIAGSEIMTLVFGAKWLEAGVYTQILSLWTFMTFISSPISSLNGVLERQEITLLFNIFLIITRAVSLVIGGILGDARLALILFSASGVLMYGGLCLWLTSLAGVPVAKTLKIVLLNLLVCAPLLLVLLIVKLVTQQALIVTILSVVLMLLYYAIAFMKDDTLREYVMIILKKYGFRSKMEKKT